MTIEHVSAEPTSERNGALAVPGRGAAGGLSGVLEPAAHEDLMDMFTEFLCRRSPVQLKALLDAIEKGLILKVLDRASGNQKEAARILGIKYTTLNQKVKKHGIRFRRGVHLVEP